MVAGFDPVLAMALEALLWVMILSAGPLAAAWITGVGLAVLCRWFHLHDPTLINTPRMVVGVLVFLVLSPWIADSVVQLGRLFWLAIPNGGPWIQ